MGDVKGQRWEYSSKLTVPADQWSYVALVITPTKATLYMNRISTTQTKTCNPIVLNTANIGFDPNAFYFLHNDIKKDLRHFENLLGLR